MNRLIIILGTIFVFSSLLFSQTPPQKMNKGAASDSGMMCPMGMMMIHQVVATSDGGVVVVVGNKLIKYDANLALKKEVDVKIDSTMMRQMMSNMSHCKMMGSGTDTTNKAVPEKKK